MSKSFSSALSVVGGVLLWLFMGQLYVSAQFLPADASMRVTRVDQNLNPISGTQAQIFGVERDASGVIGIRRIYSPLYSTNPTVFTTDLQTIFNELYALGKPYTGLSLSVTDLPYHNEYLGSCVGENCIPTFSPYRMTLTSRGFCNGTVCTEAEHLGFGGNWFIKYVPGPDVCPAGKHPFPDVTSVPCVLRSTMKLGGGTELKLESTPNIVGSCSLKTTYQQNGSSYTVTPASGSALSVSSPGMSILANVTANIPVGQDSLPNILNCPTDYVAMCSISDTGSNLCGCYFPHVPGETWAPIKPSNYTCVDDVVSTCGNPRAQVNFVPYTGIPAADQNSSTNAWDSITLGNKAVIPGGTFFDITDGANPIDDGTIVSTGLQNFAVSRHNGYIEFLALGRRLTTYYGYYQGTIKFQNVQVDRVEGGLTTATWADIGLEAVEGDTVTKVSDTEVSFKLAFANQGDGFRVYLKNPTPTPCTCPAGQEKNPDPKSPVCVVRALVKGVQDTEFILTGYDHLTGNCTLAAGTPQAPQTPSTEITVTAGQQRTSWMQGSPWTFQLDPLLTCPAGTTKTACMFTYGAGPLGEITCGCYPNGYATKTFTNPTIQGRPVYSRDGSPAQFCREQGYNERALVKNVENFVGAGSLWNGQSWEINQNLEIIKEVECSNEPNTICQNFYEPRVHGKPVFARNASPAQFCREQGYTKSATVNKEYSYEGNGSLWNGSVWEINLNLQAIREVNCCKLEDKPNDICAPAGCEVGQYWCQSENICKPAGQTCGTVTCNNNNTCEAGESCNCADCTNGGADDKDKCGFASTGAQMVCTKDVKNTTTALAGSTQKWIAYTYPGLASSYIYLTQLPAPSYTVNGKTFIVYDPVRIIKGMSKAIFLADPATAIKNAPVIPLGAARDKRVTFNLAQLQAETPTVQNTVIDALSSSVNRLKYLCTQSMVNAPECDSNSAGSWVPSFGYSENGSIYVSASGGSTNVSYVKGEKIGIFDASADATCQPYTTSSLQYIPNTDPRTQGWLNINGIGTAQNDGGKLVWQVNDGGNDTGDNAVVYKKFSTTEMGDFFTKGGKYSVELKNISASAPTSGASYLLASYLEIARGANTAKGARRFTFVFGLDADKTPTIIGLTSNGTTYTTPSNSTYKYRVDGGANEYNTYEMVYDPATDTVDMFVNGVERISNFPGNTVAPGYATQINGTAAIIFGSGTSPGVANTNYGNIAVSIKNNCPGSSVQVGACCPAGSQWDSSQGKCLATCEPIVTLKKGSELTTIKNSLNESFSTNTTCANKNISLSPCNTTAGVVADGTSPSGNKLYKWPKAASGLSKDYNLVEINGQCWFADNVEEKPSAVPTPPGAWDNFTPHNDYGIYAFAGTGVGRSEGYLYQFDAATNMVAPGGAPLDRQQGVCPAGWHVATDCEFQYVEHTLGMSVAEQQAVGASRTSGDVGTDLKTGGNSGFDMPLSGARRWNTGFINGLGEGHLWSSECTTAGCYKRIVDSTGTVRRLVGDGGTYDASHHAAGSVRCVKDGSTTPVNTCPVPGCAEGEYYCHAELKCKAAGAACGTVTCNYNNVCDTNESCDCADCNEKVDHCGLSNTGEQLICTKDTAERCYTDKFPYCLSACLDGYTRNASGQCVPNTVSSQPMTCVVRHKAGTEVATAECNAGEVRVGGGCANTGAGGAYRYTNFPILGGQAPAGYPAITNDGWACATGSTGTYNDAYAVCCTNAGEGTTTVRKVTHAIAAQVECNAGEVRVGGGCENASGGAYTYWNMPMSAGDNLLSSVGYGPAVRDGWICHSGSSGNTITAYALCRTSSSTTPLSNVVVKKGTTASGAISCDVGQTLIGGGYQNNGDAYGWVSLPMYTGNSITNAFWTHTATKDEYFATSGSSGTTLTPYALCATSDTTQNLVPPACTVRSIDGTTTAIATCQSNEVFTGGGCANTSGGAYFLGGFPIRQGESWTTYTPTYDPGYWHSLEYPAAPVGPVTASGNGYACATGYSATYVRASAVCCQNTSMDTTVTRTGTIGDSKSIAQCNAGEVRVGGGCRYISGGSYFVAGYPLGAGETYSGLTATQDGFVCVGGVGTMIEARAVCKPAKTGETVKVVKGPVNGVATCDDGYTVTGGGCESIGGAYYYIGNVIKAGQTNSYTNLTPTNDGYVCASGASGTNSQPYAICVSSSKPSTATTPSIGSQDFTYPVKIDGYVKNDTASATKFCTEKGFTSAMIISSDSSGAKKMGWNGTAWVADNAGGSYIKLLTCFGGTPQNYTCQSYTGNIQTHGGYLSIQPQSTTQFCKEAGYDFPQLTAQYSTSSSCRLWNGTSWYEDVACVAASGLQCCKNPTVTPPPAPSNEPQLGACCPPGSAWNSIENRCIPTTCGEGQFYCAAQKKCLAGGQTCDTAVCNNDGVCSGEESCQCGDCVNGGGDDKDKCSIVGGVQAMCSDDNPSDGKPGACCVPPKKWNSTTNTCVECSNTQAPSELKAGVDQPYITCTGNGDTTKTHFRYRITKQGATEAPFISEPFTIGTQVLHPTMTLGDYTVECFYGNASGVDTSTTAAPHSCVKTMSVKSDAQGCSRVYPYKENTLSDEMISSNAFDASFRCGSRKPVLGTITNPYMFRVGTQAASYLSFDALISELFNGLTIGPVSTQTQNYAFNTGNTDVTCATKVGGGYSTNTACQLRTCVGGACNVPQTFSVVHSDDLICTTEETSKYNIGCNPAAPDSVRNQCIQWFRDAVNAGSRTVPNGVEFNVSFVFNGDAPTNVTCIKYVAGQMPGGLNLSDNVVCSTRLKNGERYQIYAADTNGRIDALQTTAKTVERDGEKPSMADIKYYTDESLTTEVLPTNWYNKPVIALAVCSDTPLNEATSCACAQRVDAANTTDADAWSLGVPNSLIGADLMRYTRTITETLSGTQKVQVIDTAGNTSSPKNIAVSLDTQVPLVTPSESGTGATKTITLTASDTGSKIWKTTTAPSGATNSNGIIYRVGLKSDMANLAFNAECNTTATYASVTETQATSFASQAVATIPNINTATQVVAYCVRDNAGNTTRGMYPVVTDACFSASNMSTIPNLDTYKALLKTRLTATGTDNQKYGYSFSENTTDASCFRGILGTNITTLMTNQLKPRTSTTLSNWDRDRAELSTSTTLSNGYYYYVYPTSNTLNIVTSPSGGAPVKSVVVEGGDIRIKTDINYSGAGKTLLLIARKNSNGQGGNIIIDTNVRNIDAILIADGGALRSSDATLPGERLTINGRVYSYNTRGGSLAISGTDFVDATTPKKFTNSSLVSASSLNDARIQDLERFRPIFADGNNTCSLTVNYTAFTTANLPALLKRPNTFTGGSCGF